MVHLAVELCLWLQKSRPGTRPSCAVVTTPPACSLGCGNDWDLDLHCEDDGSRLIRMHDTSLRS